MKVPTMNAPPSIHLQSLNLASRRKGSALSGARLDGCQSEEKPSGPMALSRTKAKAAAGDQISAHQLARDSAVGYVGFGDGGRCHDDRPRAPGVWVGAEPCQTG